MNAIGKKSSSVFFFPKLSLSLICFGPSAVFVDKREIWSFGSNGKWHINPPVRVKLGGLSV